MATIFAWDFAGIPDGRKATTQKKEKEKAKASLRQALQ
jgi:hypothetical protein